jgi:hypothetical protein
VLTALLTAAALLTALAGLLVLLLALLVVLLAAALLLTALLLAALLLTALLLTALLLTALLLTALLVLLIGHQLAPCFNALIVVIDEARAARPLAQGSKKAKHIFYEREHLCTEM